MDWLINELQEGWALIAGFGINLGTIVLVAWNTLVGSRLGAKRVDNLLNFTTVAHKTFTDVRKDIGAEFSTFKERMLKDVVNPLVQQLQAERKDNEFWKNVAVSSLAVANVPLNQKQQMYEFAKKATNISQEAINILGLSIQNDIAKTQIDTQEQDALKDKILGV